MVILLEVFFVVSIQADNQTYSSSNSRNFQVHANIVKGCKLNHNSIHLNTINFGNVTSIQQPIDTLSSYDLGSIVLKCTPGVNVNLALDSGINRMGNISQGRLLKKKSGNKMLRYQLFQDAAHSIIWGNDINGGNSKSIIILGIVNKYYIYARLFNSNILPEAGQYEDIVTMTISY
ncbi:MAG: spore coat U domain-containing protein [Candidatus Dasytiphilus stammeri]